MTKEFDEKNAAKSRAVCAEMAEAANTGKRVLSERERQILDMWPKFEDGEYVMVGDEYEGCEGMACIAAGVHFDRDSPSLVNPGGFHDAYRNGERVKRPARSVLDADGVEIKVGDTVWHEDGSEWLVEEMTRLGARCFDGDRRRTFIPAFLTHTRPDSWERLEEDAGDDPFTYCKAAGIHLYTFDNSERAKSRDIIRRAKALAGIEVDE